MVDQNQFINTYIDIIINSVTDHVKSNLQLQTQVKVLEMVSAEKDRIIASLTEQLNSNKEADDWKTKYEAAETNYSAAMNKLNHMDTLLRQLSEMKIEIKKRDAIIADLEKKPPKKIKKEPPVNESDDF